MHATGVPRLHLLAYRAIFTLLVAAYVAWQAVRKPLVFAHVFEGVLGFARVDASLRVVPRVVALYARYVKEAAYKIVRKYT